MTVFAKRGLSALASLASRAAKSPSLRRMMFNAIRLQRVEIERFSRMEEVRFLAYCFLNRHQSRSQILQDLWVGYELGERRGGFFVEFGATNGILNSNTWLLEKKYGWKGIVAEPNPLWHSALRQNRSSSIDRRCVSSSSGTKVRFLITDSVDPELSGVAEFAGGDHFAEVRSAGQEIQVETVTLNQLLVDHDAPAKIDYMSIDTEGSEYDILRAFDFSRYAIELISVEQNRKTEAAIDAILTRHGYTRVFKEFSQWDGWYVRSSAGSDRNGSRTMASR
ncbi:MULTISPECIES: FkbM family methyltransferase [Bradyrhizobium]|uniref:FkbM family methyltransferase n=1 Tax=Bradyrhizobium TaxID=374 RepID=UPI000488FA65|nr:MULTISPECIES: FkbM family methyltransferase [Bradyrhizobium]QOG19039.1 FkbM family methyltransferase [Bradyrhizobium sp. SEMIA]UFW48493.1 FkbM family methyltransferase [Bradyrhizobium arachidis]